MNKKIGYGVIGCIIAMITLVNFTAINDYISGNVSLKDLSVMVNAYAVELPEVTITCDTGGGGQCYAEGDPHHSIGIFGLPMCETTCDFTGSINDTCVAGLPC